MPPLPRIALDAMGGDHAPDAIVKGALRAAEEGLAEIILVGDESRLAPLLEAAGAVSRVRVVHAGEVIGMDEVPTLALRQKKDASIVVALRLVKDGAADAVVAAGSTGAAMAAALLTLGRISGIERPAIAVPLPTRTGPAVLLDVGATVDAKPAYLRQFAVMGAVYARVVLRRPTPRVGLFNIGEEETKGNEQALKAHALLKETPGLNFVGNVEGRDLPAGKADVVVCDGFVGNGLLKFAEGLAFLFVDLLKEELQGSLRGRLAGWLARPRLRRLRGRLDYAHYGGAPLLGVNGLCIISHGSSKAEAITSAVRVAAEGARGGVIAAIKEELGRIGAPSGPVVE